MTRVLHIVTYMGRGGLETVLMNYYRNIDRSKVQFDFLVHRDFKADYDDEILSLGGKIFKVPRLVPWGRKYKRALKQFFLEHPEYKIIHVHQDCLSSVALKAAKNCGIQIRIAHSHASSQDKNFKYLIKRFYMRFIPKYATKMFACSKKAGDWMFSGTPYQVIHNAINVESFAFSENNRFLIRNEFNIPQNAFVIGHTGRFAPAKNHSFLLDVFAKAWEANNNCYLMLVGDGDLREEIENKANALGIRDHIIFCGLRDDVNICLNAFDVFVMPSHYEGLGLAAIEAQANGLNCIISDAVANDCDITKLVHRLSLNDSPNKWANEILSFLNSKRENTKTAIKNSGYDIKENALLLQTYYEEQIKGNT